MVGGGWGGGVCTVIFMSNPTVMLCCVGVGVGVLTKSFHIGTRNRRYIWSAFMQFTGNDVTGRYKRHYFLFAKL